MQLVHLEPVENAVLDRLDQICRTRAAPAPSSRNRRMRRARGRRCRARATAGLFAPAAQTSAPGSSHSPRSTGSRERRDRDDDVLLGRFAVALRRLRANALAERGQVALRAAVGDDALDSRNGCADARRPASPPGCRSRSRRASVAPSRARCFAATALAAPVRSRPRLSASITATSSGLSTAKSATTNARSVTGRRRTP